MRQSLKSIAGVTVCKLKGKLLQKCPKEARLKWQSTSCHGDAKNVKQLRKLELFII